MRFIKCIGLSIALVIFTFLGVRNGWSQEENRNSSDKPQIPSSSLQLTPQPAPEPALKYSLIPTLIDKRPGNAAVHYGKVKSEQNAFFGSNSTLKLLEDASAAPLSELERNHQYDMFLNLGPIYANMRAGARSQYVDWQLPLREVFFYEILLPEVQEFRLFGKLCYCRARIQIARHDFDGAIETIQTGLAMSRHVGQSETLISALVAMVTADSMFGAIQELIAQPGAPNLYWALMDLPSPTIDLRPGLEAERDLLYLTEPGWLHPEKLQGDEHFWKSELGRLWKKLKSINNDNSDAMLTMHVIQGYPHAKQRLIARGLKAAEVESMPVPKVMLLDALHQYNCNRDANLVKIGQALAEPSRLAMIKSEVSLPYPETLPVSNTLSVGTFHSIVHYVQRFERRRAALEVVEAMRMYASQKSDLPKRLEDITSVVVPSDPSTGKPFVYDYDNGQATLSSTKLDPELKLELSLRK